MSKKTLLKKERKIKPIKVKWQFVEQATSRRKKGIKGIESLRQKHRRMKVLNNVETWKPVLNSFCDREKDYGSQ